jgi:hypothetical protein
MSVFINIYLNAVSATTVTTLHMFMNKSHIVYCMPIAQNVICTLYVMMTDELE